jgi:hypothetical protein
VPSSITPNGGVDRAARRKIGCDFRNGRPLGDFSAPPPANRRRVGPGDYSPDPPTDPDVRISRIRFFDLEIRCAIAVIDSRVR